MRYGAVIGLGGGLVPPPFAFPPTSSRGTMTRSKPIPTVERPRRGRPWSRSFLSHGTIADTSPAASPCARNLQRNTRTDPLAIRIRAATTMPIMPGTMAGIMGAREKFSNYLAARGWRMTREHKMVLAEVVASREPFGFDQIASRLATRVSRATLHRALSDLEDAFVVRKFSANNGDVRFERI